LARRAAVALAIFAAGASVAVMPWLVANNLRALDRGPAFRLDAPSMTSVAFDLSGAMGARTGEVRTLPADLRMNLEACRATGRAEELDRYWGDGHGPSHYVTLPWRVVMNLDASGYHVTTSAALLLCPLVLLLPWFWSPEARLLRWVAVATTVQLVLWTIFGNGIPWYGISIVLGVVLAVAALVVAAPNRLTRLLAGGLVGLSLAWSVSLREGQYQATRHHYDYLIGKVTADVVAERVVPHYDDVRELVLAREAAYPSRPSAYRIGTFITYFVPHNLRVLPLADNQLDFFSCLDQEHDPQLTLRRLQALGFNSIIFDTAVQTIEADPAGSLHAKVKAFLDFVNTPGLGLQVPINDPARGLAVMLLP